METPLDRRAFRRSGAGDHGIVSARVRPGHRATVIDVSAGGALIEVSKRLLPGASVDLQVQTVEWQATVRGRVLRCTVIRVRSNSVSYRAAIAFEYPVPTTETPRARVERVDASRGSDSAI